MDVLRWYAHNRGYDGNRRWSAAETEARKEDSEKEENARTLMGKHGAKSMAETFCKELGVDPLGKKKSSMKRFKGLNAAFPREVVEGEVRRILQAHSGKLKGVDANLEKSLFSDWRAILCPDLKLPKRYEGGLLFGQLVPRFDNRIISICPISGQKVPSRNCPEFLNFRWAMQLANIRVGKHSDRELRPLNSTERAAVHQRMRERGYITPKELKGAVRGATSCERDNLDTMLMHPDAKEALLLDPVQKLICSDDLQPFWKLLPERLQKRLRGQWRRGKIFTLGQIRNQLESSGDADAFDGELQHQLDAHNSKAKKKDKQTTREELLQKHFPPKPLKLDGRAAFARHLLKQAYEDILAGKPHPKEEGGCLFLSEEIREKQLNREIAEQTNNHLVRHRLLILERLLADIIKEYADGKKERIGKITIEVNRDLREMSGKTAKEKAQDLGLRIANHHHVAEKLEKAFAEERNGRRIPITAGLIRKARIAEDLGWRCPYTGIDYEPKDLVTRRVDKDHIVPRSERASDSLDSLVITFSAINKWKGKRTAWQFVEQEQGKPVPDLPNLSIVSLTRYKQFVESLETKMGHNDDKRRKKRRKELMLLPKYEEKEFVPADLTQTSQLVRLGAQVLKRAFSACREKPTVVSLPGAVTGTVRKAWKVLGCLSRANSQVLDENGDVRTKTEIRDITHLHHALDACVLGLATHYIPNNGRVWELLMKRNPNETEKQQLQALGIFHFNAEKRFEMRDLDDKLKDQVRQRLAERRVAQHIPARMDGLPVDQNMWRLRGWDAENKAMLEKYSRDPSGKRKRDVPKAGANNKQRLIGWNPPEGDGKLQRLKAVLITNENYGVAILDHALSNDDRLKLVPFHKVFPLIFGKKEDRKKGGLVALNQGRNPRILRLGNVVLIPRGTHAGCWRIFSVKNNTGGLAVSLGEPDALACRRDKQNVGLKILLRDGLKIVGKSFTGIAACPTTSSA